jgi:prepilin-type N-terminal cleavage/methylation domain-containing protein
MVKKHLSLQQSGFTILELMIATAIVSVVLLIATMVMIGIQNVYNKGITQENVQNDVRNIAGEITQEVQDNSGNMVFATFPYFSRLISINGGPPTTYTEDAVCIGSVRYLYVQGLQVGTASNDTAQALWRDVTPTAGCGSPVPSGPVSCNPAAPSSTYTIDILCNTPNDGGTAYIPSGATLTNFQVGQVNNSPGPIAPLLDGNYGVAVGMAIGNYNLLDTTANGGNGTLINNPDVACKNITEFQFCAASSLTTEIGSRVQ